MKEWRVLGGIDMTLGDFKIIRNDGVWDILQKEANSVVTTESITQESGMRVDSTHDRNGNKQL